MVYSAYPYMGLLGELWSKVHIHIWDCLESYGLKCISIYGTAWRAMVYTAYPYMGLLR